MLAAGRSDTAAAEHWFQAMEKAGVQPDFWSHHWMVETFSAARDLKKAMVWLDRLHAAGFSGNEYEQINNKKKGKKGKKGREEKRRQ